MTITTIISLANIILSLGIIWLNISTTKRGKSLKFDDGYPIDKQLKRKVNQLVLRRWVAVLFGFLAIGNLAAGLELGGSLTSTITSACNIAASTITLLTVNKQVSIFRLYLKISGDLQRIQDQLVKSGIFLPRKTDVEIEGAEVQS